MAEELGPVTIIDTLTNAGAIGVMAVFIWAFLKGKIVSEKTHDDSIADQKEIARLVAEGIGTTISKEIKNGVAEGMKQGIAEGYLEINGGHSN